MCKSVKKKSHHTTQPQHTHTSLKQGRTNVSVDGARDAVLHFHVQLGQNVGCTDIINRSTYTHTRNTHDTQVHETTSSQTNEPHTQNRPHHTNKQTQAATGTTTHMQTHLEYTTATTTWTKCSDSAQRLELCMRKHDPESSLIMDGGMGSAPNARQVPQPQPRCVDNRATCIRMSTASLDVE